MTKKKLESYQSNKRLIERNKKKIEDERYKDIPTVMGKVTGTSADFPYTKRRFTVQMNDPAETDKASKRILKWQHEIKQAEKDIEEVERFIAGIEDATEKEIFELYYLAKEKQSVIASTVGYTQGRISQIITKHIKD